jgi:DNA-binding HxlR family transcriptional regulator
MHRVFGVKRTTFSDMNCSVARALEVVGEWWSLLIIRDALFGVTRFEEFHERLGIARNILAKRLDMLVDAGVLERRTYDEARDRNDYVLTPKGRALWPVIEMLRQWGDEWITGAGNEPVSLVHDGCGAATVARLVCDHCGETLELRDLRSRTGPGGTDPSFVQPRRTSTAAS